MFFVILGVFFFVSGTLISCPSEVLNAIAHSQFQKLSKDQTRIPDAVARLGKAVFVTVEAAKLNPDEVEILYVNPALFENAGYKFTDEETLRRAVVDQFALQIPRRPNAKKWQGRETVTAYVDRQTDPSNIAMGKNEGSGRAFYLGKKFNLKGIGRTPLAKDNPNGAHGDGWQDLQRASFEAVASNVMENDLESGTSPVVAVIGLKGSGLMRAIIVRVDDGALDRPTHVFLPHSKKAPKNLTEIAEGFGRQEGEKFLQRIVHGAWSAGNISIHGHTLDMETVAGVSGRQPSYSLTGKYPSNYFGHEIQGQLEILRQLKKDPKFTQDKTTIESLERSLYTARKEQIKKGLPRLMGMDSFRGDLGDLADEFFLLSQKAFPDLWGMERFTQGYQSAAIYDFSGLFRKIALLKLKGLKGRELEQAAFQLLRRSEPETFPRKRFTEDEVESFGDEHGIPISWNAIQKLAESHIVFTRKELNQLDARAKSFIANYISLLEKEGDSPEKMLTIARGAYVRNEDRHYMSAGFGKWFLLEAGRQLQDREMGEQDYENILGAVSRSSLRMNLPRESQLVDARIYRNGAIYRQFSSTGKPRLQFEFFPGHFTTAWKNANFEFVVDGTSKAARLEEQNGKFVLIGAEDDFTSLLKDEVAVEIRANGKKVKLHEVYDSVSHTYSVPFSINRVK